MVQSRLHRSTHFILKNGLLSWKLLPSPPLQELSNCEPKYLLPSSTCFFWLGV
ncbi:hypothetical protein LEMLEM_LOCUS24844 [Lemmus lemmus]